MIVWESRDNTSPRSNEIGDRLSFNLLFVLAKPSSIRPTTLVIVALSGGAFSKVPQENMA
jgi:hypothetical protein